MTQTNKNVNSKYIYFILDSSIALIFHARIHENTWEVVPKASITPFLGDVAERNKKTSPLHEEFSRP